MTVNEPSFLCLSGRRKEASTLRLPNNRFSHFLLLLMFLCGVAMVVIPMISQQHEIAEDDSLYAMLAQEMQAARITKPESSEDPPDISETAEHEAEIEAVQEATEGSPIATDLPESDETEVSDEPDVNPTISTEEPVQDTDLEPAMIVTYPAVSAEPDEGSPSTNPVSPRPTVSPKPAASPKPTNKPESTASQNKDYVAWLTIPGTVINYPVVRSDRTDYYLHHLITGQESKLGTLFSLKTSDYETPSKNIAIYGHHLSASTAMFSTLMEYKKESYWKAHQTIQLDTIYGKRTYRIFAVLNHTVSDWDASTASFKNDESFLKFVNRAKKKAFYDTGIEVSETDNIITLITCDRSFGGVQGRLLVMGVEQ